MKTKNYESLSDFFQFMDTISLIPWYIVSFAFLLFVFAEMNNHESGYFIQTLICVVVISTIHFGSKKLCKFFNKKMKEAQ